MRRFTAISCWTFAGMEIAITEGYGLTETSPVVTGTPVEAIRYGSVGRPIEGVAIRLAADGEIQVKGPNVMLGYYHLPGEHPFTSDGWFLTGDYRCRGTRTVISSSPIARKN